MELTFFWLACQQNNNPLSERKSIAELQGFYWNQAEVEIVLSAHCISLRPLSDSHLASGLDTRAHDWMV